MKALNSSKIPSSAVFTSQHGIASQKTLIVISTAVGISALFAYGY
jgi:hypothetical protein